MVCDYSTMANVFVACAFAAVALCAGMCIADAVLQRSVNKYDSDPVEAGRTDPGPRKNFWFKRASVTRDQNADLSKWVEH